IQSVLYAILLLQSLWNIFHLENC
ncbi:unnamed protein product, partial [Rotaria magnacalcarata]